MKKHTPFINLNVLNEAYKANEEIDKIKNFLENDNFLDEDFSFMMNERNSELRYGSAKNRETFSRKNTVLNKDYSNNLIDSSQRQAGRTGQLNMIKDLSQKNIPIDPKILQEAYMINEELDDSKKAFNSYAKSNYNDVKVLGEEYKYWQHEAGLDRRTYRAIDNNYMLNEAYNINDQLDKSFNDVVGAVGEGIRSGEYNNLSQATQSHSYWRSQAKLKDSPLLEVAREVIEKNKAVPTGDVNKSNKIKDINKAYIDKNKQHIKNEGLRRQEEFRNRATIRNEERLASIDSKRWFGHDSLVGKLHDKHKKRKINKKNKLRRQEILEKKEKQQVSKKNQDIISNYENMQSRLNEYEKFSGPPTANVQAEMESASKFMSDKSNYFDYKNAQLDEGGNYGTWAWQKDKSNLNKERKAYEQKVQDERKVQLENDKIFATDYIEKQNNVEGYYGQGSNFDPDNKSNNVSNYSQEEIDKAINDNDFINNNKEQYNNISSDIKLEALNDIETKDNAKAYESRKNRLNAKYKSNREELKNINTEIRQLKNYKADYYTEEDKKIYQQKLDDLMEKKRNIKSKTQKSRKEYKDISSPIHVSNGINSLNNEINILDKIDKLGEAEKSLKAGSISQDAFNDIAKELFPNGDMPKVSGRTKAEIQKDIVERQKIMKHLTGKTYEASGDIVDQFKHKMKKANKLTIATSVIAGISQYKDARKEGKSAISSVARAGVDFALSETLGGLYLPLQLIKSAPSVMIKGAEMVHKEVRGMNTASRFTVFGESEFQDTEQLATMRQSGMELAKASQYRLEQTLMGNEAKYLHR